jgi:hypothetical protein
MIGRYKDDPNRTHLICNKCKLTVIFSAKLSDSEMDEQAERVHWTVKVPEKVHICDVCCPPKWGAY